MLLTQAPSYREARIQSQFSSREGHVPDIALRLSLSLPLLARHASDTGR